MSAVTDALEDLRAKIEALPRYDLQLSFGDYWITEDDKGDYLSRDEVLALLPPQGQIIHHSEPPRTSYEVSKIVPRYRSKNKIDV